MPRSRALIARAALILALAALFGAALKAEARSKRKPTSEPAPKISLMRPWELRRLASSERLEYFRTLQKLMSELESATTHGSSKDRNAWLALMAPFAHAQASAGEPCLVGGYMSQWKTSENGRLQCAAPGEDRIFDVSEGGKSFHCGATGSRQAHCNSAWYLYAGDEGERHCQSLEKLGDSCADAFDARYGRGGDPNFPERLNRDLDRFSRGHDPKTLDEDMQDFQRRLNMIADDDSRFDEKTRASLRQRTLALAALKERASEAGKREPELPLVQPSNGVNVQATSGSVAYQTNSVNISSSGGAQPVTSGQTAAPPKTLVSPIKPQADTTPGAGATTLGVTGDTSLLGKELACVQQGLQGMGYQPSELFLALLATGVQASGAPHDVRNEDGRRRLRTRMISMVQAYGFCDENSYPSKGLKSHERRLLRRWLTADGGNAKAKSGLSYLEQMTDAQTKTHAAHALKSVFGLDPDVAANAKSETKIRATEEAFAPYAVDEKKFQETMAHDRGDRVHDSKPARRNSRFASCEREARQRREKDDRFRLRDLKPKPIARDGRRPPFSEAEKIERTRIAEANRGLCETMARSCGMDAAKICQSGQAIEAQPSGTRATK